MLSVLVSHLKNHFYLEVFSVLYRRLVETRYAVHAVSVFTPSQLLLTILRAHYVLVGGGSLIKNLSMLKLAPILFLCVILKKRFVFFGVEIHNLWFFLRGLFLALYKRSILVYTRNSTVTTLGHYSYSVQCKSMPDLAFALAALGWNNNTSFRHAPQGRVGVNVRPSTLTDHFDSKFWRIRVADLLQELGPTEICFLSFQPCDRGEISKLVRLLAKRQVHANLRVVSPASFEEALKYMGETSLAIGMRLHFLVFASMLGIPFIPVPYHEKVVRFANSVDRTTLSTSSGPVNCSTPQWVIGKSQQVLNRIDELIYQLTME